jgi:hypothetical protein
MQSLCTLRSHCRQRLRNTSLPSGRYPLPGPDFHRLDRTSLRLAHLFDHLVGASEQRCGHFGEAAEYRGSLQVDDKVELGGLQDRQVYGFLALDDAAGIKRRLGRSRSILLVP